VQIYAYGRDGPTYNGRWKGRGPTSKRGGRREIREERRDGKGGDGIFPKVEVSRINTA